MGKADICLIPSEKNLPASILIGVEIDDASAVSEYAGSLDGVEDIQYYRETVEKLTSVTRGLQIEPLWSWRSS